MEKEIIKNIVRLEVIAKNLNEQIEALRETIPLDKRVQHKQWVIEKSKNKYYQYLNHATHVVSLKRGHEFEYPKIEEFNKNFRLATKEEVFQHENFLLSKQMREEQEEEEKLNPKPTLPEFYMLTVNGDKGSIVRHATYECASQEAIRLAKRENNRVHIMGVVGIVEPKVVQQPIIEYQVINK